MSPHFLGIEVVFSVKGRRQQNLVSWGGLSANALNFPFFGPDFLEQRQNERANSDKGLSSHSTVQTIAILCSHVVSRQVRRLLDAVSHCLWGTSAEPRYGLEVLMDACLS